MTESEYLEKFRGDIPSLEAWGKFIISEINDSIVKEYGTSAYKSWIKIPPQLRVKDEASLISKAFILNKGWFSDIYHDIADKVGIRYVVGLTDQISNLTSIIKKSDKWIDSSSKEFDEWKRTDPRIFDYQSEHFILTSIQTFAYNDVSIPTGTKCEIQIRTLLQHAYAELSHDTLYKSNVTNEPEVHRLFAKSMALMETTDDMLLRAKTSSQHALENIEKIYSLLKSENKKYLPLNNFSPKDRENLYLIDQLRPLVKDDFFQEFENFLSSYGQSISGFISQKKIDRPHYELDAITLVHYLARRYTRTLPKYWPFDRSLLDGVYSDLGITPPGTRD